MEQELKKVLENLLQNPDERDNKGMLFFLSEENIMPNADMTSFLYGAKKYHDYLENKIVAIIKDCDKKHS